MLPNSDAQFHYHLLRIPELHAFVWEKIGSARNAFRKGDHFANAGTRNLSAVNLLPINPSLATHVPRER